MRASFGSTTEGQLVMQLDEFVQTVLVQIASGISKANVELTGVDDPTGNIPYLMDLGNGEKAIAFDVAVTTQSAVEGELSGRSKIFVADASLEGKATRFSEQVSRVQFSVGVDQRIGYSLARMNRTKKGT